MRRLLPALLLALLPACEGPSEIYFLIGEEVLADEAELVLCEGTALALDLEYFSAAGSTTDFVIDELVIDDAIVRVEPLTGGDLDTHRLELTAQAPGRTGLAVHGAIAPGSDDAVIERLPILVVACPPQ
jgi:hypothetical protein